MEKIIRNRIIKKLALRWLGWIALSIAITALFYCVGGEDSLRAFMPAQKITAGEDLSNYEGKNVRCSVRYVGYPVLQYYSATDPTQKIYACGYVALDDHLKNPFCVFVPVNKAEKMNYLLVQAWSKRNGDPVDNASMEVRGIVSKLPIDDRQYYVEAVQNFYGTSKPLYGEVYYIDNQAVVGRKHGIMRTAFLEFFYIIGMLAVLAELILCTVKAFGYPKVIYDFLLHSKMSKSQLETSFQSANELCDGIWIGPEITVFYDVKSFGILRNRDLVWAYVKTAPTRGRQINYFVELFDKNQKQCAHIKVNDRYDAILNYYEEYCPHMVVGDDEEKRSMFRFAFNRFLRLRYYWNLDMQYEEQPAPDYNNDLCGYQNLSFDEESGRYEDDHVKGNQEKPW